MGWLIIVGTIPIVVLGLLFQTQIETVLRSLWVIAVTLIVFGVILGIADMIGAERRKLDDLTVNIGGTYPLSDAKKAQEDLAARRTTGKLLLTP